MSARLTFDGLAELKAQLRELPEALTTEGGHMVEARANSATATIKAGYPTRTGNLRDGMDVHHSRSRFGARSVVINTDKDAQVYEHGSQARHNRFGANRGSMPPDPIFTRTVIRQRRALYETDLVDLLTRNGLTVIGHA